MTAEDKANELIEKFMPIVYVFSTDPNNQLGNIRATVQIKEVIRYSIICVEEILDFQIKTMGWDEEYNGNIHSYQEVKQILTDKLKQK